eukprot:1190356-Prorocentrum_minimum.AAC.2
MTAFSSRMRQARRLATAANSMTTVVCPESFSCQSICERFVLRAYSFNVGRHRAPDRVDAARGNTTLAAGLHN